MTAQNQTRAPDPFLLLFIAVAAQAMVGGDFSLASVAMPSIERGLGITPAISQWVLTADLVAYAGILIVGGRLADIFGQKIVLTAGIALFLAGSFLTSVSPNVETLLAARVVQGLGGGMIYPSAFSLLTLAYPPGEKRFKAYTINMACQALGTPFLTILAGWGIGQFGWRSSFLINVPICVILLLLMLRMDKVGVRSDEPQRVAIPYANAAILTCAMASLIYALSSFVAKAEHLRAAAPYALSISLVLVVIFALMERRSSAPLIPPSLLRTRNFAAGVALVSITVLAGKGIIVLSNISLQKALGFTALEASYALLPFALASLLLVPLSPITGRLLLPFPKPALAGMFGFMALLYLILSVTPGSTAQIVLLAFLFLAPFASVTGVNMALNEGLKTLPGNQQGVATAIIYTVNQIVTAVGMAVLIAAPGMSTAADPFGRFAPSFQLGAGVCIIGLLVVTIFLKGAIAAPRPDAGLQGVNADK